MTDGLAPGARKPAGLGDWWPNMDRLPEGIKGLSEKVEAPGLKVWPMV